MREPLHPIVQLMFGKSNYIVTIPPDHLVEFTAIEKRGTDLATFIFIDPTYTKIEKLLFQLDKEFKSKNKKSALGYRWGYPGLGLEQAKWKLGTLSTYTPTITTSGMRVNIGVRSLGTEFALFVEPKTYYGKISAVVKQIAIEMGFTKPGVDQFIEETDDELNDLHETEYSTGNNTRIDLINSLIEKARSLKNPNSQYTFRLSSDGSFHFHTPNYMKDKVLNKLKGKYRKFEVLFGNPDSGVISFSPTYNSKGISGLAQTILACTYDPKTKQYQKRLLDRDSMGLTQPDEAKGAKTSAGPLITNKNATAEDKEKKINARVYNGTRQRALGGRCAGKTTHQYAEPEAAMVQAENAFKSLHELTSSAVLELVGLPEYADFSADEDKCDIYVVLPEGSASEQLLPQGYQEGVPSPSDAVYSGLHWSSGRYLIRSVTHSITGSYTITAELKRSTMLEGPDDAKTGAPKKISATVVKVAGS
jgi:hypothetical protein